MNKEKKEIEELREKFYTEFSIQVHRREDGTLQEFGLDEDMADLGVIADFWLKELDSYANKKVEEAKKVLKERIEKYKCGKHKRLLDLIK